MDKLEVLNFEYKNAYGLLFKSINIGYIGAIIFVLGLFLSNDFVAFLKADLDLLGKIIIAYIITVSVLFIYTGMKKYSFEKELRKQFDEELTKQFKKEVKKTSEN